MTAPKPLAVQGAPVRAAGASPELVAAYHTWLTAHLARETSDSTDLDRAEQVAWDTFADLASEAWRCYQCLTDMNDIPGWTNAYCPEHAEADVLRDYHDWKAQQ